MLVREFIDLLRQSGVAQGASAEQLEAVNQLSTILTPHQDMELETLFDLFRKAFKPKARGRTRAPRIDASPSVGRQSAEELTSALRTAFTDDASFSQLINGARANRALTIVALKKIFADLFGRSGNFRSKATRDEVLRKILDERNIKVRNDKMGQMLGRKPVAAE